MQCTNVVSVVHSLMASMSKAERQGTHFALGGHALTTLPDAVMYSRAPWLLQASSADAAEGVKYATLGTLEEENDFS